MNGRIAKIGAIGVVFFAVFALTVGALRPAPVMAAGGPVFLTGHDPDFHAQQGQGAKNLLNAGLSFVTGGTHNLNDGNKFLWVESRTIPPRFHAVGENGLVAIGLTLGTHYDRANAAELPAVDLSNYTAIAVASSFVGLFGQAELDALTARKTDISAFINAGGGLLALSECLPGSPFCGSDLSGPIPTLFGFLPVTVSAIPASPPFMVTAFGAGPPFNLVNSDLQDITHNSFSQIGGLTPVDTDSNGQTTTLAGVVIVTDGGFEPVSVGGTTSYLFGGSGGVTAVAALAGGVIAVAVLAGGVWYTRRRWLGSRS